MMDLSAWIHYSRGLKGQIEHVDLDKAGTSARKCRQFSVRIYVSGILTIINFMYFVHPSTSYQSIAISKRRPLLSVDSTSIKKEIQYSSCTLHFATADKGFDDGTAASDLNFMKDLNSRTEELQVHLARDRLEQANTAVFLKRKPRKLPYEDARRWIQANLGPDTKEEFYDLVENGNLRTPYIPKRPEEYYTETREWISWDHFLKGIFDSERPSAVKPISGVFD